MNIRIVDEYSKNDSLNILKEECAELIVAASHLQRARGDGYETHRTEEKSLEDLIQAMADCQNALDSLVYALKLDKDVIQQKIKEVDERRAKQLYGRNVL